MSEDKVCHFHGRGNEKSHPVTHILRITCQHCGLYQVVYTCKECTNAVRTWENQTTDTNVSCPECAQHLTVKEHWKIIGAA